MTQEQLSQIFADICIHGRHVEGWSCEERGAGHVLIDNKRTGAWERVSPEESWVERKT